MSGGAAVAAVRELVPYLWLATVVTLPIALEAAYRARATVGVRTPGLAPAAVRHSTAAFLLGVVFGPVLSGAEAGRAAPVRSATRTRAAVRGVAGTAGAAVGTGAAVSAASVAGVRWGTATTVGAVVWILTLLACVAASLHAIRASTAERVLADAGGAHRDGTTKRRARGGGRGWEREGR